MTAETYLFYDFETFGADPRRDRPAQFAAVRTDSEFNPVEEPAVFYCRPADDVLPQPAACLITGITPQLAAEKGLPENEFAGRIFELMSRPNTCVVGYNNFRFDDEVARHLFWRNFMDPYSREYANGNSRLDLIDILRMTRALRPDGLAWPDREDGRPSFRLEDVAAANGLDTSRAHDALADVEATIGMAELLGRQQPRLWDWALGLRDRRQVVDLLGRGEPLLHTSSRYPVTPGCHTAPVLPLGQHPQIASQWLVWNLGVDPAPFFDFDEELLEDLLWTPAADLPEDLQRLPLKVVRANRCPMLSPMGVLDDAAADRLEIDPDRVRAHAHRLATRPEFTGRLTRLFERPRPVAAIDPELDLYGGFPPPGDQRLYPRIRAQGPEELARLSLPFADERLNELLFRYRARLWPETMDEEERQRWEDYRHRRLITDPDLASIRWPEFRRQLDELAGADAHRARLATELAQWAEQIGIPAMTKTEIQ